MADETVIVDSAPGPDDELELVRSTLAPEYEIVEELGRGGMAVVYRAREHALDRDVAIKVLPLAKTFDPELVARFQREARMAASLEHPHIIPIYRVGQSGRVNFFVMKFVKGASLADSLRDGQRLPVTDIEKMLVEVGEALDHAHRHGVIHRDVKPDNVMKDPTGRYVVMDFGIAKSIGSEKLTQLGGSIGTPKYMSPEQGRALDLDGSSDFYSLGVVAYHCFTGRPPFEGEDPLALIYAHLHDPVPEPTLETSDERRVYAVIRRLLEKNPQDRLRSGADVREALRGAPPEPGIPADTSARDAPTKEAPGRDTGPTSDAPTTGPRDAGRIRPRGRTLVIAAGSVVVLLLFFLSRGGAARACREALPKASEADRAVLVEPLGTVRRGTTVEVSYVLCGAPKGLPFRARVTVRQGDGGGVVGDVRRFLGGDRSPVRVSWDDVSDGFATSRTRDLNIGALAAGSYRVTVTVEDEAGRETESSHDFTVVEE